MHINKILDDPMNIFTKLGAIFLPQVDLKSDEFHIAQDLKGSSEEFQSFYEQQYGAIIGIKVIEEVLRTSFKKWLEMSEQDRYLKSQVNLSNCIYKQVQLISAQIS